MKKYIAVAAISLVALSACGHMGHHEGDGHGHGKSMKSMKSEKMMDDKKDMMDDSVKAMDLEVYAQNDNFLYTDYSKEAFDAFTAKKVLFVASKACGTCVKKHKALMETEGLKGRVFRVEFDKASADLKKQFEITKYDTFYFVNGDGTFMKAAGVPIEELVTALR